MSIEKVASFIPEHMLDLSGSVFYSGRRAYSGRSPIYILGLNPGGDPIKLASATVAWHARRVIDEMPDDWSAYRDESWNGAAPGTCGMQPRVLHLFDRLGLNPGSIAASNIVFARSTRESTFRGSLQQRACECWPLHEHVIKVLDVKVVLCLGRTAADWVCKQLGAGKVIDEYVEDNDRRWKSRSFSNGNGSIVVSATHPSIADWTNPNSDPTVLVERALGQTQ